MGYADVGFANDDDVGVLVGGVGEEVEGEDDGAVGGVFEGDDAEVGLGRLDGGEDGRDAVLGDEGVEWGGEGGECGLGVRCELFGLEDGREMLLGI